MIMTLSGMYELVLEEGRIKLPEQWRIALAGRFVRLDAAHDEVLILRFVVDADALRPDSIAVDDDGGVRVPALSLAALAARRALAIVGTGDSFEVCDSERYRAEVERSLETLTPDALRKLGL